MMRGMYPNSLVAAATTNFCEPKSMPYTASNCVGQPHATVYSTYLGGWRRSIWHGDVLLCISRGSHLWQVGNGWSAHLVLRAQREPDEVKIDCNSPVLAQHTRVATLRHTCYSVTGLSFLSSPVPYARRCHEARPVAFRLTFALTGGCRFLMKLSQETVTVELKNGTVVHGTIMGIRDQLTAVLHALSDRLQVWI